MSNPTASPVVTLDVLQKMLEAQAEQNRLSMLELAKALRAPADLTESEQAVKEQELAMRKERGKIELQRIQGREIEQENCIHIRKDGTSTCVHIHGDNSLNDFMICQQCQGMIHAGAPPTGALAKEFEHGHIFNTRLFNEHLIKSQVTSI